LKSTVQVSKRYLHVHVSITLSVINLPTAPFAFLSLSFMIMLLCPANHVAALPIVFVCVTSATVCCCWLAFLCCNLLGLGLTRTWN